MARSAEASCSAASGGGAEEGSSVLPIWPPRGGNSAAGAACCTELLCSRASDSVARSAQSCSIANAATASSFSSYSWMSPPVARISSHSSSVMEFAGTIIDFAPWMMQHQPTAAGVASPSVATATIPTSSSVTSRIPPKKASRDVAAPAAAAAGVAGLSSPPAPAAAGLGGLSPLPPRPRPRWLRLAMMSRYFFSDSSDGLGTGLGVIGGD